MFKMFDTQIAFFVHTTSIFCPGAAKLSASGTVDTAKDVKADLDLLDYVHIWSPFSLLETTMGTQPWVANFSGAHGLY